MGKVINFREKWKKRQNLKPLPVSHVKWLVSEILLYTLMTIYQIQCHIIHQLKNDANQSKEIYERIVYIKCTRYTLDKFCEDWLDVTPEELLEHNEYGTYIWDLINDPAYPEVPEEDIKLNEGFYKALEKVVTSA